MTNFPTTLDTFQNPEASTPMDAEGLEHDAQHANLNDAVRALQVKVGADNSGVVTSFDYRLRQLEQVGGGGGFSNPLSETLSIAPANNTSAIHVSGYSLTGNNAQAMLDLAGTWNTVGSPTAIKVNITNTASGGNSLFADFQLGGVSKLSIDKFGDLIAGSAFNITAGGDLHLNALSHQIYLNAGDAPSSAVNICGNALFIAGYGLVSIGGPTQSLQFQSDGITLFQFMGTWNTTETASGLSFNVIDQASAFDSVLLDLQVNGSSVFKVDKRSVASVTYIQNAQEQLMLSGDSGNLYLYYPASGHNAITADDSAQTLSFIETGSDQVRAQVTAYADFVFYDSTNGNQPCFTIRGDGSGIAVNGQGSGSYVNSGQIGWWTMDGSTRLGLLQDDGSGTYGMVNLFGDSTVDSCICEFDAIDRSLSSSGNSNLRRSLIMPDVSIHTELRVFTLTIQTDVNAGGYAAAFNPRDGGGGFVNQLYINASGVGIAMNNPLHALDVNGSIGNSNGDINIVGDQTGNNGSNINIRAGDSAGGGGYYTGGNISLTAGGGGTDGGNDGSIFLIAGNRGAGNGSIVLTPAPGAMAQVAGRFRVDDSISAPATHSTPAFTSYYGSNAKVLGDPDEWLRINVGGTDYKVPLFS